MKVLVTGGAGFIGAHVALHLLEAGHDVVVLDDLSGGYEENVPSGATFVDGSVTDPEALKKALAGVDAFIWLVMRKPQGGSFRDQDVETIAENYDVNCKGLHLCLFTAQERFCNLKNAGTE